MPLLACVMTPAARPSRPVAMLWIIGGMLAAFLLAAPYTFLDLPTFLNQFARLSSEYRAPPARGGADLGDLSQAPAQRASCGRAARSSSRASRSASGGSCTGPDRLKWALVTIFPLVYFRFISNQNIFYGRYLLPLLPFLSILAAAAVVWMRRLDAAAPTPRAACAMLVDHRADARRRSRRRPTRRSGSTPTPPRSGRRSRRTSGFAGNCPPGTTIRLEGSLAIKLPAAYKTSYVKQLRLDGVESYAGRASSTSSPRRSATAVSSRSPRSSARSTRTTSGSSPRRRKSRASRRRTSIRARSCIILKVKP